MAALAAILLLVAWGMSEVRALQEICRQWIRAKRPPVAADVRPYRVVDLTVAIGVGVTLASLLFMARMSETAGLLPEERSIDDPAQRAALPKGVQVFRIAGPLFFGVAREMLDALQRSGGSPTSIILRMESVPYIDSTGASALQTFVRSAHRNGTRIILCELREQPAACVAKLWPSFIGAERIATFHAALQRVSQP